MASPPLDFDRDYVAVAKRYARAAVRDKKRKRHCEYLRQACKRFLDDLKHQRSADFPYYFDDWHGSDPCDFIEKLPHIEGQWSTDTLLLSDWEIFIIVNVFGWRRVEDDGRRFSVAYIEVARKNGKSALTSGVMLYCLCCEGEPAPQIKTAATTGEQARIIFDVCGAMCDQSPDLVEHFSIEVLKKAIVCHQNYGSIKPINAKASTQDGLNPHAYCIDELHAHKDRALFDVLRSAAGARRNLLAWYITTAGFNMQGVCFQERLKVVKMLEGILDLEHYFGIIFTLDLGTAEDPDDPGDDFLDEKVWIKANPNLGITPSLQTLRNYSNEARADPDSAVEFQTKRCNIWLGSRGSYFNMVDWRAGGDISLLELRDLECFGGLDLASTEDFATFHLVWRLEERLKVWGRYYLPEATVPIRTEQSLPYKRWEDLGLIRVIPGKVIDYAFIESDIRADLKRFKIREIGFDPWNARDIVNRLYADGAPMVEYRQGPASFNNPMREMKKTIKKRSIDHGRHPILTWMFSNLVAREDINENVAPDRRNSQEKIDGAVSTLMGFGLMLKAEEEPTPQVVVLS